ncbi:MAG: Calx-beta domain-containing protein [Thermoanaerobaculia bacterium]
MELEIPPSTDASRLPSPLRMERLFVWAVRAAFPLMVAAVAPALAGPGRLSLQSGGEVRVVEAETTVSFTVLRTDGADGSVSVDLVTCCGDATPGADYESVSETLVWASGDSSPRTVQVTLHDDLQVELPTEVFLVSLSGLTGGAVFGTWTTQAVDVDDDEVAPHGRFTLQSPSNPFLTEAEVSVTLIVQRTEGVDGAVSVRFRTCCGDATAGSDYETVDRVLMWGDGDGSPRNVEIAIHDDLVVENPTENFSVLLSSASGGAWYGAVTSGLVTLRDNDNTVHGRLSFSGPIAYRVPEQEGEIALAVTRAEGSAGEVSVRVTTCCGDATAGADYAPLDEVLTWADGDSDTKIVLVTLLDDDLIESPTETFLVGLSELSGGAVPGAATLTTIEIEDDKGRTLFGDGFESGNECIWSANQGGSSCAH